MHKMQLLLLGTLLLCFGVNSVQARENVQQTLPVPQTVSPELQTLMGAKPVDWWNSHPQTPQEWKKLVDTIASQTVAIMPTLREKLGVTSTSDTLAGVPVYTLTPKSVAEAANDIILLHLHGGGYVFNPGESGTFEGVYAAGLCGMKVIAADYRMPPEFPYPAAMDDAISVYRELLKTYPADKIGVFGSSSGGGMVLALVLRAKAEGLPLPGAIVAGTPWSDMTKTGDSYVTNEGIDNSLVSYDGWLKAAAALYANGHDLRTPQLSPIYGDLRGFPPTMLITGTRDLFLSNTVRMHIKLREAGVMADLLAFEGMSHAQYYILPPSAPETIFLFKEMGRFFMTNLHRAPQSVR